MCHGESVEPIPLSDVPRLKLTSIVSWIRELSATSIMRFFNELWLGYRRELFGLVIDPIQIFNF